MTQGETYYVRGYATNSVGISYGNEMSFTTLDIPQSISTSEATSITTTSAVVESNIDSDGGTAITERGIVYSTSPNPTTEDTKVIVEGTIGTFEANMEGLSEGTTYYIRAYAINSVGTAYGNEVSVTVGVPQSISTTEVTSITTTSAVVEGDIGSDGGDIITERGLVYSTSPNPTIEDNKVIEEGTTGTFTSNIEGLSQGETYYVRAYATNTIGTAYGNEISFITLDIPQSISTIETTSKTTTSAVVKSNIDSDGGATITERGIVYSTSSNPTVEDNKVIEEGTTGIFTSNIEGLSQGETYYVRAYATNSIGTAYGNEISFTTLDIPQSILTTEVTNRTFTTAITGGYVACDGGDPIIERGIVYGREPNLTIEDNKIIVEGTEDEFQARIEGLVAGGRYFARAYAKNSVGVGYGNEIAFRTRQNVYIEPIVEPTEESDTGETDDNLQDTETEDAKEEVDNDTDLVDERVITTEVTEDAIIEKINQNERNITISSSEKAENIVARLNVETVKRIQEIEGEIEVKNDIASYRIPAREIVKDEILKQFEEDIELRNIEVDVSVKRAGREKVEKLDNISRANGFEVLANPVEFKVSLSHGEKRVEVNRFNRYIERRIAIPENVDITRNITGVVLEEDGTVRQVPTRIVEIDGKYYAEIRSITNSVYSIVSNSIEFKDAENHWARESLNDMGSRFIISGREGLIEPEREVTRTEFVGIVLRALGIRAERGNTNFEDILEIYDSGVGYIEAAYTEGLISGYEDRTFRGNEIITREEAMVIISRAMRITELEVEVSGDDLKVFLTEYKDFSNISDWAKSSVLKSIKAGIIVGRGNGRLEPNENLNISEAAAMVRRLLQKSELL